MYEYLGKRTESKYLPKELKVSTRKHHQAIEETSTKEMSVQQASKPVPSPLQISAVFNLLFLCTPIKYNISKNALISIRLVNFDR